jgi:hypothetical protein
VDGCLMLPKEYQQKKAVLRGCISNTSNAWPDDGFYLNVFYEAKLATAARHTEPTKKTKRLRHKHKTRHTDPSFIPFPFGFLSAFAGEMLIKNHQLCKSSFASSPVAVWQFVLLAVPVFPCLPFLV